MEAYPYGDILGGSKQPVGQDTHERRVETELHRELSQGSIRHALRDNHGTHGDTYMISLVTVSQKDEKLHAANLPRDLQRAIVRCNE